MRSTKYGKAVLAPIVKSSRSLTEVISKLGLSPSGGNFRYIGMRVRTAGLDTSHFMYGRRKEWVEQFPLETLEELVSRSTSVAQVLQALGLPDVGRPHKVMTARIEELGLDTSHFLGRGWSKGETARTNDAISRGAKRRSYENESIFIENSPLYQGPALLRRLLALGWTYRCSWCGLAEWRGERLVLHVDHANGIHNDNRLENLRLLCPNCHSQTETYSNRRRR